MQDDGAETVLEKAIKKVAKRNAPGMSQPNLDGFLAFPAVSDEHFIGVAADSAIVFDSSLGTPLEILGLVRAKELAQATIAEAISRAEARLAAEAVRSTAPEETSVVPEVDPEVPDDTTIAELVSKSKRKKKGVTQVLGSRPNLRDTPARQARARVTVSK